MSTPRRGWQRPVFLLITLLISTPLLAEPPRVVTTIPPVHALVAGVTEGVSEPHALIRGGQSPHGYSLAPSDARELNRAAVIFAAGESVEGFLTRTARSLPEDTRLVWMEEIEGMVLLDSREGGGWEPHDHSHNGHGHDDHGHDDHGHDDHGHDDHGHDDHGHDDHGHDDHGHDDHGHDDHGHDDHGHDDHGHAHGGTDGHLWLDPRNAIVLTEHAAAVLAELDPDNADTYRENARRQVERLEALERELHERLAGIRDLPYLVFHDAYQYFERRFGLNAIGSVTIDPERAPGARRINELSQRVEADDVVCVFSEPQFEPRVIRVISEGTNVRIGELDPLGGDLEPGPGAYEQLLRDLAAGLEDCLAA